MSFNKLLPSILRKVNKKGFISIPLVVILSALIIAIGFLISTTAYNEVLSSSYFNNSSKALYIAESAYRDILRTLTTDQHYGKDGSGNYCMLTYGLDFSLPPPSVTNPVDRRMTNLAGASGCADGSTASTACSTSTDGGCAYVRLEAEPADGSERVFSPRLLTITGRYKDAERKIQVGVFFTAYGIMYSIDHVEIKETPTVLTARPTIIEENSATLNGWVNPNNDSRKVWFKYSLHTDSGTNPTYCSDAFVSETAKETISSANTPSNFSADISDLQAESTYYYCAIVGDSSGNPLKYGSVSSFETDE